MVLTSILTMRKEEIKIKDKIIVNYLMITFLISYGLWGTIIIANQFGYLKIKNPVCMSLLLLGAFGPTISSYIVQKKDGRISSLKDFIRKAFRFKDSVVSYSLVILFLVLYFIYPAIRGRVTLGIPIYLSVLMIPLMLFGGGMEEVGWRWVLQPELEKIFPFGVATVITSLIWTFWHLPLFFIKGSSQSYVNFFAFLILLIGMSFAQATIYGYSKNIWLCALVHCSLNALPITFVFEESVSINIGISIIMVVGSLLVRQVLKKSITY